MLGKGGEGRIAEDNPGLWKDCFLGAPAVMIVGCNHLGTIDWVSRAPDEDCNRQSKVRTRLICQTQRLALRRPRCISSSTRSTCRR